MRLDLPPPQITRGRICYRDQRGRFIKKSQYLELLARPTDKLAEQMAEFGLPLMLQKFLAAQINSLQTDQAKQADKVTSEVPTGPGTVKPPVPPDNAGYDEKPEASSGADAGDTPLFDFPCADLRPYNFSGWNLRRANLQEAKLQNVCFEGANLEQAKLQKALMQKTRLNSAYLGDADLCGADLKEADLSNAHLYRAKLISANLWGADLTKAILQWADLTDADLTGAILSSADLSNADLTLCKLDTDISPPQLAQARSRKYATRSGEVIEPSDYADLRANMTSCFNEQELRTLCFDLQSTLQTDYDNLPGNAHPHKVRELIDHCIRHGHIRELILACRSRYPRIIW